LVGVRTKPYCVEHILCSDSFKIGELVEVQNDFNLGIKIVKVKEEAKEE